MDYIYTTTVKLNTQEAKRELDKLQQRIDDLKARKEDAMSSGKNNIADQLNKEIQASERVMEQLKKQQISLFMSHSCQGEEKKKPQEIV